VSLIEHTGCNQTLDQPYAKWYFAFIGKQIDLRSSTLPFKCLPTPASRRTAFLKCLAATAKLFAEERDLPLAQIMATLSNDGLIVSAGTEDARCAQFVFTLLGLLTFLYEPSMVQRADNLQLNTTISSTRRGTWRTASVEITETLTRLSIGELLHQFGGLSGPIPRPILQDSLEVGGNTQLRAANVSFYALLHLAEIEIEWTSSACQHLEFDLRNKKLHLFRYPSFCAFVCAQDTGSGPTSKNDQDEDRAFAHLYDIHVKVVRHYANYRTGSLRHTSRLENEPETCMTGTLDRPSKRKDLFTRKLSNPIA
jgi:hypothetical protein